MYFATRKPKAVLPPVPIQTQTIKKEEEKKMDEKFVPSWVPEGKEMGWNFKLNGEELKNVQLLEANNPRIGTVFFAWNGRFGQPLIKQNPGRMVIYASNHPELGWIFGGADEPRVQCNGTMFTAAGGYDPAAGSELKAIQAMPDGEDKIAKMAAYEKATAAREVLDEMGLHVTDLKEIGRGLSNRSIYMTDLTDTSTWNGETYYLVLVPAEMLEEVDGDIFISLPEDKLGDVMPAPEWSGIKKLEFKTPFECFDSPDSVAVAGYAKALAWVTRNM